METPGDRIKKLREDFMLNQVGFAERIGFSASFLAKVEQNKQAPSRNMLEAIRNQFTVSIDWILYGKEERHIDFLEHIKQLLMADKESGSFYYRTVLEYVSGFEKINSLFGGIRHITNDPTINKGDPRLVKYVEEVLEYLTSEDYDQQIIIDRMMGTRSADNLKPNSEEENARYNISELSKWVTANYKEIKTIKERLNAIENKLTAKQEASNE